MEKNQIYIKCGTEYTQMTKELLEVSDLSGEIEKKFLAAGIKNSEAEENCHKMRIGIKPNLVAPMEAYWGGTTHPEVAAGIIEYLQEKDFRNLVIMEGSWVGDKTRKPMRSAATVPFAEKYQVPFQ